MAEMFSWLRSGLDGVIPSSKRDVKPDLGPVWWTEYSTPTTGLVISITKF